MTIGPSDSTLSTFTASDGDNIAVQDWPLPEGLRLRGVVLLVHGLGEHAGRHDALARRLNQWGFAVRGYDQYGHGESGGVRGALPSEDRLIDDLSDLVDSTRARLEPETPLLLLGHSMGGLVAAAFVARCPTSVDALVLSSPALEIRLTRWQRLLLAVLPRFAPNLSIGSGLDPDWLARDAAVVAAYEADPLVHDRVSGRLARFIAEKGAWVIGRASEWAVPTLLLYAGADHVVNPAGSRRFAAAAPPDVVTTRCFADAFHEIFNEPDTEPVFNTLCYWLDAKF